MNTPRLELPRIRSTSSQTRGNIEMDLRRHGLQPHRLRHFMASNDPAFEAKAADIIGLYLAPPAHDAVFCVDEKTAIQALDRLDPVLAVLSGTGRASWVRVFPSRHPLLYAALETRSGQVLGSTASRHTSGSTPSDFDMISRYLSIQCLLPLVRRKRSAALRLVFHLLGGIETRRHTIVTSPDWTGTTLAGRGRIVTPASVGIPRKHAKTSSFRVDPAGTMRLSSAPESDGAQYHRVHSRVCSL